jgi:hypothetical protein
MSDQNNQTNGLENKSYINDDMSTVLRDGQENITLYVTDTDSLDEHEIAIELNPPSQSSHVSAATRTDPPETSNLEDLTYQQSDVNFEDDRKRLDETTSSSSSSTGSSSLSPASKQSGNEM